MKKRLSEIPRKDIILGSLFVIILVFILPYLGVDTFSLMLVFMGVVEWLTKFILPWIVLYWIIRLIKNFETN